MKKASHKFTSHTKYFFICNLFLLLILSLALPLFSQDCPSCPKKEEDKKQSGQQAPKEYMDGDMKVVVIPSRYSREELEKMFPVPEQWKEWYRLEKEGKLPKYVKIVDLYQAAIDQCKEERKRYVIEEPCKIDMNDIADK